MRVRLGCSVVRADASAAAPGKPQSALSFPCTPFDEIFSFDPPSPTHGALRLSARARALQDGGWRNYSAWHYRSKLLPQIYAPATAAELAPAVAPAAPATEPAAVQPFQAVLLEELELLRNAFFTAPEDQSAWFYHRWVLAQLEALAAPPEAAAASSGSPSMLAVKAQEEALAFWGCFWVGRLLRFGGEELANRMGG